MEERETELLPIEISTVPEFIQLKAEYELGESAVTQEKCLTEIIRMIQESSADHWNTDPEFILRFMRAKKFNSQKAFKQMRNYFNHRIKFAPIYKNLYPTRMKHVIDADVFRILPLRTPSGCVIFVADYRPWHPETEPLEDIFKLYMMTFEIMITNPVTQICGMVGIFDFRGLSVSQMTHLTLSRMRLFITAVQDVFPMRQKGIHVLFQPPIFTLFYALITPFLKKKFKDRIFLHGYDMSSLHKHIPQSALPEEFGGTLPPFEKDHFFRHLLQMDSYFKEFYR